MFKLHDIRKTRVWQEAYEEGRQEGLEVARQERRQKWIEVGRVLERKRVVPLLKSNGYSLKDIAELLKISVAEVRRLAKR